MDTSEKEKDQERSNAFMSFFKKEKYKFFLGLISTTLGVLLALLINSSVQSIRDHDTYHSMLKAIKLEAKGNRIILEKSFIPNYDQGIVFRDFSINTTEEFFRQPIFIKYASDEETSIITNYILELKRASVFRAADEKFMLDPKLGAPWISNLRIAWGISLKNCDTLINKVETMQ